LWERSRRLWAHNTYPARLFAPVTPRKSTVATSDEPRFDQAFGEYLTGIPKSPMRPAYTGTGPERHRHRNISPGRQAAMNKRDNETLEAWATRRASTPRQKNLVALLAVRDDIKAGLDAGYPALTIWRYLHEKGRVPCQYDTFRNFVNRYIRKGAAKNPAKTPPVPARAPVLLPLKTGVQKSPPEEIRGFTFNPVPRKEDLI